MPSVGATDFVELAMQQYDKQGCLHEQFIKQAKATPEALAVVTQDGNKVTYGELDQMSEDLATRLRHLGVTNNTVVGILMERCLEYVISYIAILRAGGAYLPVEVSYPPSLLKSVLEDARPVAVCTKTPFSERLSGADSIPVLLDAGWLDRVREENSQLGPLVNPVRVSLDDMAYTVYSSGTTGKPKGIQCPHRGAVFSYYWRHVAYPYGEDEREACNVFFVWEMLRPLLKGVTLYVIPDDVIYDPPRLVQFLEEHHITRMLFTPSLLQAVLDYKGLQLDKAFQFMRQIWFCGEVVTSSLRDRFVKLFPHIQILNLYSISECHDVSCADLSAGKLTLPPRKFCPAGKLLPGVHVVVMDDEMNVKPIGVKGEIYVGGPALAIGYLNLPDINAKRFIPRPKHLSPVVGDRLYRTGDWGYVLSDGNLEICGRCDSMVKIRGYSIETQAIEAALMELPMVNAGCVSAQGDEGSDKFLVAYIVPRGKPSRKEIRSALKKRLPFYMIPSRFIFLDSVPILETSGKLDKNALPKALDCGEDDTFDPRDLPSTLMEHSVSAIWCKVLKLNVIDVQENFFDLGGHSLLATQLLSELNEALGLQLVIHDLFQHPTVSSMATYIENPAVNGPLLNLVNEVQKYKLDWAVPDVQLRAFWHSLKLSNLRWRPQNIFLTGATGYVGTFILKELLLKTQSMIYCLVRQKPTSTGLDRILESLVKFGVANEDFHEKLKQRVVCITGDVSLLNLGMEEDDFTFLSYEIDTIIHAAATVNLVYPYHALVSSNVLGTQNILTFAMNHKIKVVHHISTDAVFPGGLQACREDADMIVYADKLRNGYAQTKWVAEQLVISAQDKGLPAAIYRCGNVGGSQEETSWNPADFTLLMLQGCLNTLTVPDIKWQIELSPVDFVSQVIVELSQNVLHSVGNIFHLVNPCPMNCRDLWELLRVEGYPVQVVPYCDWYLKVKEAAKHVEPLTNLSYLLDALVRDPSFFSNFSTFMQTNLLQKQEQTYPPVNANLMREYLKRLTSVGFIPQPCKLQQDSSRPLQDKVALVTGSSSGIGTAIAEHLAAAGAKVALAARRTERLTEVQAWIEHEGGVAVTVTMDVCDEKQVQDGVKHIESLLGPIDILVNNAGVLYYTVMKNLHLKEWQHMVDVNVKGVLNCVAAVLGGMVERKQGHIVNISSDAGRRGFAGLAVYSGTKFFVEGMSQALRQELSELGVKVTCIQPGDVKTELFERTTDLEAQEKYETASSMKVLDPKDVAQAVIYAVTQPEYCAVNEILVEHREAPI